MITKKAIAWENKLDNYEPWIKLAVTSIVNDLNKNGRLKTDWSRNTLNLSAKKTFAGLNVTKTDITVGFILNRRLRSPKIGEKVSAGEGRTAHYLGMCCLDELDSDLMGWLKESMRTIG